MRHTPEVEEAKRLLTEAKEWGTFRWLAEKRRVRAAADRAWAELEEVEKEIKSSWGDDLRKAYRELQAVPNGDGSRKARELYTAAVAAAKDLDAELKAFAAKLKAADDEAFAARMDAEDIFDKAERHMSASMARHGSERAVEAYEMREKFIRRADAARRR